MLKPILSLVGCALVVFVAAVPSVQADLIGHWAFDEGTGSVATDATGNHDGTITGATWVTDDPVRGTVLQFDGDGDYVVTGDAVIPQMTLATDFTWACWARSDQVAEYVDGAPNSQVNAVIIGNRRKSSSGGEWDPVEFIKLTPSKLEYYHGGNEPLDYNDLLVGEWHHHAVVKDGNTLSYYRDGVLANTRTITLVLDNPQPFFIGGDAGSTAAEHFNGRIDDVRLYDAALTADEVSQLVPEPSSLTVLLIGCLCGLFVWSRRSRG